MQESDGHPNREMIPKENEPGKPELNNYIKYTGLAFQMMAIIALSAFIGYKIDQWYDHKIQWVTALSCVLGVCLSIYQIIRQLKT